MSFSKAISPLVKDKWLRNSFFSMVITLIGMLVTFIFILIGNNRLHYFYQNRGSQDNPCVVKMEIPLRSDGVKNCWQMDDGSYGAQYDIYLQNKWHRDFQKFKLIMSIPEGCRIDSSWNGIYKLLDKSIVIEPSITVGNTEVVAGSDVKFGFVLYAPYLLENVDFEISGYFIQKPMKSLTFTIFFALFFFSFIAFFASSITYSRMRKQAILTDKKIYSFIKLCAGFIDVRDEYTKMHSTHVAEYSREIAERMGFSEDDVKNIYYCGLMHDVGKVLIPRSVLCKNGPLTEDEWKEMKRHTTYGAEVLEDFEDFPNVKNAALFHHERFDGTGYPSGLRGKDIPLIARIICVADSYDAMATDRAYRKRLDREVIISELKKNSGSQFDPEIAEIMLALIEDGKVY